MNSPNLPSRFLGFSAPLHYYHLYRRLESVRPKRSEILTFRIATREKEFYNEVASKGVKRSVYITEAILGMGGRGNYVLFAGFADGISKALPHLPDKHVDLIMECAERIRIYPDEEMNMDSGWKTPSERFYKFTNALEGVRELEIQRLTESAERLPLSDQQILRRFSEYYTPAPDTDSFDFSPLNSSLGHLREKTRQFAHRQALMTVLDEEVGAHSEVIGTRFTQAEMKYLKGAAELSALERSTFCREMALGLIPAPNLLEIANMVEVALSAANHLPKEVATSLLHVGGQFAFQYGPDAEVSYEDCFQAEVIARALDTFRKTDGVGFRHSIVRESDPPEEGDVDVDALIERYLSPST